MTNREWINSLSDDDFVKWSCAQITPPRIVDGKVFYDKLHPTLREVTSRFVPGDLGLLKWLKEDRIDYSMGVDYLEIQKRGY